MRTILVISESRFFRESLVKVLQTDTGLHVLGALETKEPLGKRILELHPEIVVMHLGFNEADLAEVRTIHEAAPEAKILVAEMKDDRKTFLRAVCAGARGFSLRDASPQQIRAAAHRLGRDGLVCPRHLILTLFQAFAGGLDSDSIPRGTPCDLSPRELQIAKLVRQGMTNKEIADRLNLSVATVKTHLRRLFQKTNSESRVDFRLAMEVLASDGPLQ